MHRSTSLIDLNSNSVNYVVTFSISSQRGGGAPASLVWLSYILI